MKILLVHAPQIYREGSPQAGGMFVYIMAMGLFSLASQLQKAGHRVSIVHLGIETLASKDFAYRTFFESEKPDLVGFSLNWHPQIYETLESAAALKKALPGVPVFFGGFTASVLAEELLNDFAHCVDFIIRGDGELPLLMLAEALCERKSLDSIPNLLYRRKALVVENPERWTPYPQEFSSWNFADFKLLRSFEHFSTPYLVPPDSTLQSLAQHKVFYLATSRGCTVNCAFCGGGQNAHRLYFKRNRPIFRNIDSVLQTMESVVRFGWDTFYICFKMPDDDRIYYPSLFQAVRDRFGSGKIKMFFESALLPCEKCLDEFASTFDLSGSQMILSPTSHDEEVRRRFLGSFYGNSELFEFLDAAGRRRIPVLLYYSIMPGQNIASTKELIRHQSGIESAFGGICQTMPIELEPGSPWALQPQKYQVKLLRRSARDYYEHHRKMSCSAVALEERVGFADQDLARSFVFYEEWRKRRL